MKIFLKIIDDLIKGRCSITKKKIEYQRPLGFFHDDNIKKPVHVDIALEQGFKVSRETYQRLQELLEAGMKYEEVQKSAHKEFVNLKNEY